MITMTNNPNLIQLQNEMEVTEKIRDCVEKVYIKGGKDALRIVRQNFHEQKDSANLSGSFYVDLYKALVATIREKGPLPVPGYHFSHDRLNSVKIPFLLALENYLESAL